MNGKEVIKHLEAQGWEILRVKGSHCRMGKDDQRTTIPIVTEDADFRSSINSKI